MAPYVEVRRSVRRLQVKVRHPTWPRKAAVPLEEILTPLSWAKKKNALLSRISFYKQQKKHLNLIWSTNQTQKEAGWPNDFEKSRLHFRICKIDQILPEGPFENLRFSFFFAQYLFGFPLIYRSYTNLSLDFCSLQNPDLLFYESFFLHWRLPWLILMSSSAGISNFSSDPRWNNQMPVGAHHKSFQKNRCCCHFHKTSSSKIRSRLSY